MENYEQKYKEALGRANAKIETYNHLGNASVVKSICEIFPELKESEDERIRRELIKVFEERVQYGFEWKDGIPNNAVIAWLEKQDPKKHEEELERAYKCADEVQYRKGYEDAKCEFEEQGEKTDIIENFDTEFEKQVSRLISSAINKEFEYNQDYVKWTANALLNYAKHELKKQGEQKHTDKVKPKFKIGDTIVEKDLDEYDYETIKDIKDGRYIFTSGYSMNIDDQEGWQFVKTPANIQQNPTWSEEDEDNYDTALWHIKNSCGKEGNVYNWLKSLKERLKGE